MIFRYDFEISDLLFRVESPKKLQIPNDFLSFQIDIVPGSEPDILLEVIFETIKIPSGGDVRQLVPNVFLHDSQIWARILWRKGEYVIRNESVGRGHTCRLFIPSDFAEDFCERGKWLLYLAFERLILPYDRFFLHASAVIYQGKAYLFSAPSGTGKSTHAALWKEYYGAEILNGDKVIVAETSDGWKAYGGPVAGSSEIYCNDSAPIAAVVLLQQGVHNYIAPVSERMAILSLYSEAIKSSWDSDFNCYLLELIENLRKEIPVLSLACLAEKSAVECVLQYFKEIKYEKNKTTNKNSDIDSGDYTGAYNL